MRPTGPSVVWAGGLSGLSRYCSTTLHAHLSQPLFVVRDTAIACGLGLDDGRRVVVKLYVDGDEARIHAFTVAQRRLAAAGFPAPAPVAAPVRIGQAVVTAEGLAAGGRVPAASEVADIRALGQTLAWLTEFTPRLADVPLPCDPFSSIPAPALWRAAPARISQFRRTSVADAWIDAIAAQARDAMRDMGGRVVLGHRDWCGRHLPLRGDRVAAVYDWESLCREREPIVVGQALHSFTQGPHGLPWIAPTLDGMETFLTAYEEGRGETFSRRERGWIFAVAVYGLAFTARCEPTAAPDRDDQRAGFRRALRELASTLLRANVVSRRETSPGVR